MIIEHSEVCITKIVRRHWMPNHNLNQEPVGVEANEGAKMAALRECLFVLDEIVQHLSYVNKLIANTKLVPHPPCLEFIEAREAVIRLVGHIMVSNANLLLGVPPIVECKSGDDPGGENVKDVRTRQ